MAIFITFDKRNGYFYQKIGIKAGISPFCRSIGISIGIEFQSFMLSVSVSVSKLQTCIVSVSYRYRLFRPGKYQYRIGIEKSGIEDLWLAGNQFLKLKVFEQKLSVPNLHTSVPRRYLVGVECA